MTCGSLWTEKWFAPLRLSSARDTAPSVSSANDADATGQPSRAHTSVPTVVAAMGSQPSRAISGKLFIVPVFSHARAANGRPVDSQWTRDGGQGRESAAPAEIQ